jgi:hypothetical protein
MTSTDTTMHDRVAAALETGESVFSLVIARMPESNALAIQAVGHDPGEAGNVMYILRAIADQIENHIYGEPDGESTGVH